MANRLPRKETYQARLRSSKGLEAASQALTTEALGLVNEFIQLRNEWSFQTAGTIVTKKTPKKRSREEFESEIDFAWHEIDTFNKR